MTRTVVRALGALALLTATVVWASTSSAGAIALTGLQSTALVTGVEVTIEAQAPAGSLLEASIGVGRPDLLYAPMAPSPAGPSALFRGLEPDQTYLYRVVARSGSDRAVSNGSFTTGPASATPLVSTQGTAIELDGEPFFPILGWEQCPASVDNDLTLGVTLFMGDCGTGAVPYAQVLDGRAYFLIDASRAAAPLSDDLTAGSLPAAMIGYFQQDEADGNGVSPSLLPSLPVGDLVFETFTYHFAPSEAPLAAGAAIYPAYVDKANVFGFDVYPLAQRCPAAGLANARGLDAVFDDQRALETLVGKHPTYQWIEVNGQNGLCGSDPVPPAAVAAESWLAVAGGATGLGYFTQAWQQGSLEDFDVSAANEQAVEQTVQSLDALAPALTTPPLYGTAQTGSPLKVGARELNGAVYVIAVNTSATPVRARFSVAALAGAVARGGFVDASVSYAVSARRGGGISDTFAGYGVHVYVFPPVETGLAGAPTAPLGSRR